MTVFKFCLNVALYTMWMVTLLKVLKRRFSMPATTMGSIVVFFLWFSPSVLLPLDSPLIQLGQVIPVLGWYVLFKDNLVRVTATVALIIGSLMLVEVGLTVIFPEMILAVAHPEVITSDALFWPRTLYLPANALLLYLTTRIMNRHRESIRGREWVPLVTLTLMQICFVLIFVQLGVRGSLPKSYPILGHLFFIFVLFNLIFLYIIRSISARSLLESRRELLDRQLAHQTAHYAALTEQYEAVRHMRHDIANHMHTIRILLKEGQQEQAAAYARELEASYAKSLGRDEGEKQAEIPNGTR